MQAQQQRIAREQEQAQERKRHREWVYPERLEWLGWGLEKLDEKLKALAATQPRGLPKSFHSMGVSVICWLSMIIGRFIRLLRRPSQHDKETTQNHDHEVALNDLHERIEESTSRLRSLKHEEELAVNHAAKMGELLTEVAQAQEACKALEQQLTINQRDASTYKRLAEAEVSSLDCLRSEQESLTNKLQELATKRELFAFWSSALTKRTTRISSSSSPKSTAKAKAKANFREHILIKLLSELNTLLAQVLTVLYDDTRHAHVATGMLRSLFESHSEDISITASSSGSILDQKLALPPSLAYAKRSSGERKRVDLALFFALLQLARARSAHRAHYLLVDEVFDNLDRAGQAAVVRWCGVMSQTMVGWIVVITHSQYLMKLDPGEDTTKVTVITAKMGQGGTELFTNGRSIGGGGGDSPVTG
ncbi:hypothetical protein QBC41DRAFT_236676 [Cercophora samala]|uniref:Uncharacterized protein n=1 Tax=Cercophora samala TaxID=330535 RepID=A0AA39YZB1_9PEZI|nr:hypothetical protein QBC41DRAFT_236676 [Cercophora samala]